MPDAARPPRFFVAPTNAASAGFSEGQPVDLPPTEAHHATGVLRLKVGDRLELFDGLGGAALGRLTRVKRGEAEAVVETVRPPARRPQPLIHLGFAVPKGSRLDWLLEKTAELGVAGLRPVLFERSVAGGDDLSPAKRQRWLGHCIAAAKQAGCDFLPTIGDPLSLAAFLGETRGQPGIYGDLAPDAAGVPDALRRAAGAAGGPETAVGPATLYIVVGPEGGFVDAERNILRQAGFLAVRLGWTTLRIETAAVALTAAVLASWPTCRGSQPWQDA